jgi:hypothetical protein
MAAGIVYGVYDRDVHGNDDEYRSTNEPEETETDFDDDFPYASKQDRNFFNQQNT